MQKCEYDRFIALYFREVQRQDDKWTEKERTRDSQQKEKDHHFTAAFHFPRKPPCTDAGLSTRHWSGTYFCLARTHIWVCFQPKTVFKPAVEEMSIVASIFFLPCYAPYLHTLTSSTLKLPHCWCSGSIFPNINLTHAFSCCYISSCSFFSPSSFIRSSRAYWYKPCGCRPERWWWLGHVSNIGQAFWKESCWGGNLNVLRNELWCLSCVRTHRCVLLFNWKKCVLLGHNGVTVVLFDFSYD